MLSVGPETLLAAPTTSHAGHVIWALSLLGRPLAINFQQQLFCSGRLGKDSCILTARIAEIDYSVQNMYILVKF
jgi:hypothetical protein